MQYFYDWPVNYHVTDFYHHPLSNYYDANRSTISKKDKYVATKMFIKGLRIQTE